MRRTVNRSSPTTTTVSEGNECRQTQERNTRARTASSGRAGRIVVLEDHPFVVWCSYALGSYNAILLCLGESSPSLPPGRGCEEVEADRSCTGKGVLGGCESANLTDLAGDNSLGDPGIPADLKDSIRKFLTDPLLESGCMEGERG